MFKAALILMCAQSLSRVWLFVTLWTVALQALPSVEFSRQEYWMGSHSLLLGIFPTQGSNLGLSYIDMNQPWSYMYPPSRSPLPSPSPPDSSGSSQCTRPEHLSHACCEVISLQLIKINEKKKNAILWEKNPKNLGLSYCRQILHHLNPQRSLS